MSPTNPLATYDQIRETMRECVADPADGPLPRPNDGLRPRPERD